MTTRQRKREGFALMAALWLVVLVGVTGYELSVRARSRRLAVANALETVQARAAAEAALETARAAIEQQLRQPRETRVAASVVMIDPLSDLAFVRADTFELGNARSTALVHDAGSRLQVNRATEDDIRRFLVALPLDARIADHLAQSILDWRDPDDFRRPNGAERDDYLHRGARVLPANADFRAIDELRDVDGMTADVYARIAEYLSVTGSGQINLNSAPRQVLRSLPGIGDEAAGALLQARQAGRPLQSLTELSVRLSSAARQSLLDATAVLMPRVTFEAHEVAVEAFGWVQGSPVRVPAIALFQRSGDVLTVTTRRVGP